MRHPQCDGDALIRAHDDVTAERDSEVVEHRRTFDRRRPGLDFRKLYRPALLAVAAVEAKLSALRSDDAIEHGRPDAERFGGGLARAVVFDRRKLGAFVFSTGRSGRGKTGAAGEARPISGWSKAKTTLDKIALQKLQALAEERREELPAEFPEWHLHDLRRTCATNLARLGVDRVVISEILNHAKSEVTAIYDRHRYHAEMRRALDAWGQRLQAIVAGKEDSGNVVTFATATAL